MTLSGSSDDVSSRGTQKRRVSPRGQQERGPETAAVSDVKFPVLVAERRLP